MFVDSRFLSVCFLLVAAVVASAESSSVSNEENSSGESSSTSELTHSCAAAKGSEADADADGSTTVALTRFPSYGTLEFDQLCPWTAKNKNGDGYQAGKCTLLVRPGDKSNEGIADFLGDVAGGVVHSAQLGCHLVLDYGPNVDIQKVLKFVDDTPAKNWTVPSLFANSKDCSGRKHNCHRTTNKMGEKKLTNIASAARQGNNPPVNAVTIPSFRFAYSLGKNEEVAEYLKAESSPDTLPGYKFETGMACALGSTFAFSPDGASEYVPSAKEIYEALHDEEALVIAVYLRTGHTDKMARHEREQQEEGNDVGKAPCDASGLGGLSLYAARCAQRVEKDWLSRPMHHNTKKRIIWMVTSDSAQLAGKVFEEYNGHKVSVDETDGDIDDKSLSSIVRTVLTTGARGIQTRSARNPATDEFVEALTDWWLLGESDVVVSHSMFSFAHTAAMRTARPIYRTIGNGDCYRLPLPTFEEEDENFPRYNVKQK